MTVQISVEHREYRLEATITFADLGPDNSIIQIFDSSQPAFGGAAGAPPLVEMILAKPCGSVASGVLVLEQEDPTGDMILVEGDAVWGRWLNGNGDIVADGDVTDDSGSGFFKVAGTAGTHLFPGARARLGTVAIT